MEQGQDIQLVLTGMRGMKNKEGHFICVMNGQIFDGLYKTSLSQEKDTLVYVLGEDATELSFYYIFYPNRKLCLNELKLKVIKKCNIWEKTKEGKMLKCVN